MTSAKPIQLEFLIAKGKLAADWSAAVDAMGAKLTSSMGAAVARVEAQIAKLNKTGLTGWNVDGAAASFANVTRSITQAESAVERFNRKARAAGMTPSAAAANPALATSAAAPRKSFAQTVASSPVLSDAYDRAQTDSLSARLRRIGDDMVRLNGMIGVFRSIGNAVDQLLIDPFKRLGAALIDVTEHNRKFELSISGVLGGMGKAREVNDAIHAMTRDLPLTIKELQDATRGMSFIPALGSKMASGNMADIKHQIKEYSTLLNKMAILDPEQGIKGAGVALREAMSGEFRSLRLRFEVSPQQIARTIGKSLDDLARDPSLTLKAVNAFANIFVPDESITNAGKLYSVRIEKLKDQASAALRDLGNAGIYDDVVAKLEGAERKLFDYFKGDRWKAQASRVSASLSGVLDSAVKSVGAFLEAATGSKANSIGGIVEGFVRLVEKLSDASRGLIPIANNIGAFVAKIAGALADLDNRVGRMSEFEPGNAASKLTKALVFDDGFAIDDMRREAVSRTLQNAGLAAPATKFLAGQTPSEVYNAGGGVSGYMGQAVRNLAAGGGGFYGERAEQTPYNDFGKYEKRIGLIAENIQRVVDGLDEATLRNPSALAAALKDSGLIAKLNAATGRRAEPSALETVVRKEGGVYNFGAEASGAVQLLGRVSSMRNTDRDKLTKLLDQAGGTFTANLGTDRQPWNVAGIFKRLDDAFARESDLYVKAMEQAAHPDQKAQVMKDRAKLDSGYRTVRNQMIVELTGTASDFGVALADTVKDLPPSARALILDRVATGTTAFAEQVKGILIQAGEGAADVAKKLRLDSLPLRDQLSIQGARTAAHLEALGQGYNLPIGASAEDVVRTVSSFPDAPATIARRQANYLKNDPGAMAEQLRIYREAADGFNPAEEKSVAALAQAQAALTGLVVKMREARDAADTLRATFLEFGVAVEGAFQNSLGDALYGLISKTGTVKDVLISFAQDIGRAWSQMIAKMAIQKLLGDQSTASGGAGGFIAIAQALGFGALGLAGGTTTTSAPGGGSYNTSTANLGGGTTASVTNLANMYANGGIVNGFSPIRAFASGGIVNRPVIGIVGEGKHPEAIIPMPDGRSVGVTMTGAGQQGNIYMVASMDEAIRNGFRQHKDELVNLSVADIKRGGALGKTIRRRGR